jgi:hypothetical protein
VSLKEFGDSVSQRNLYGDIALVFFGGLEVERGRCGRHGGW